MRYKNDPKTEREWYEELLRLWDSFEADWEPKARIVYRKIQDRLVENFDPEQSEAEQSEVIENTAVDIDALKVLLGSMFFALIDPMAKYHARRSKKPKVEFTEDKLNNLRDEAVGDKPKQIRDHVTNKLKLIAVGEVDRAEVERKAEPYIDRGAKQFVRTNTTSMANMASIKIMEMNYPTAILQKRWISMRDNRVRPAHIEADERYGKFGRGLYLYDYFEVDGEFLPFPAGGLKPSNNINCRCSLTFDVYED